MGRVVYTGAGFVTVNAKQRALTPAEIEYNKWRQKRDHDESIWPGVWVARDLDTSIVKAIYDGCTTAMTAQPRVSLEAARQVLRERELEHCCHAD